MTSILAVDPGTTESAWVHYVDGKPHVFGKDPNAMLLPIIESMAGYFDVRFAIEQMQGYAMNVGNEVFRTCEWAGRFLYAWESTSKYFKPITIGRKEVKIQICGSMRANDKAVSHAIAERYGFDTPAAAKGTKKNPGPLYGVKADVWAALAVAITVDETMPLPKPKPRRVPTRG